MKPCYLVLTATNESELERQVQDAVEHGYMPCGGVAIEQESDLNDASISQAVCSPDALLPAVAWLERAVRPKKK